MIEKEIAVTQEVPLYVGLKKIAFSFIYYWILFVL